MWFGLAAIALVGAVALLYIDRSRRDQLGRVRQLWAKAQGYTYSAVDEDIIGLFRRAALAKPEHTAALDVVRGVRRGEKFVLFDVEEETTIVAVQRPVGSAVDIDLRLKSTPPPRDRDMELLGSIGPRVVFATDIEIARRVCDQRMAAFTETVPSHVSLLWSENEWTLGSLPLGSSGRDWDAAIDAVARLSGMLHVLPPVSRRPGANPRSAPPRSPQPQPRSQQPQPQQPQPQQPQPQQPKSIQPTQSRRRPEPERSDSPRPPIRQSGDRDARGPRPVQGPAQAPRVEPPRRPQGQARPTPITRDSDRRPTDS
ncbi:hypothetical protein [Rhodococcoides yunnanense]|uniref:hypothetical protein n=1 Tax=Rhodococcoides yunnanense TaxID=278209 RepID=UPI0009346E9C|nr:hypothetical protein [Rhodococcus yunnanensis]